MFTKTVNKRNNKLIKRKSNIIKIMSSHPEHLDSQIYLVFFFFFQTAHTE